MSEDQTIVMHCRLPPSLFDRLDEYWHARRLPSRSIALRELLIQALDAADGEPPQPRKREAKR